MSKSETMPLSEGYILSGKKSKHRYRIMKYLGRGGFGITYLAQEDVTVEGIPQSHTFTIKEFCLVGFCVRESDGSISVPDDKTEEFNEAKEEFRVEADHLHRLSHPGIVPVSEVFEQNNTVYYVMQYLGDTSLSNLIMTNGGRLDEELAVDITRKVASSLRYLHEHLMTHLDVKPDNIMLLKDSNGWQPVLIDFGLSCHYSKNGNLTSKVVASGTSKGYSPSEQYEQDGLKNFTPQADIYSLGATLFHMLTGEAPVIAKEISTKYIYTSMPDGVSDRTTNALVLAMQKRKEDRPADVDAFLKLLGASDAHGNIAGGIVTERMEHRRRKTSGGFDKRYVYLALAAFVVLGLLIFYLWKSSVSEVPVQPINTTGTDTSAVVPSDNQPNTTETPELTVSNQTNSSFTSVQQSTSTTSGGASSSSSSADHPVAEPQKTDVESTVSTVKDLGYAVWHGSLRHGKPDGEGRMVFKRVHVIDSFDPDKQEAESGDYVEGIYEDGHLVSGKWYDANGNKKKSIYIGGQ